MAQAFYSGFGLGFSLILAIGAQNAFVLKQGLKKHYVFLVCLICAASDALLISLGIAGFGKIVDKFPSIEIVSRYCGAAFLAYYATLSFLSAIRISHQLDLKEEIPPTLLKTVSITLAFTWLNPHVYLDTFVLMGSISTQYEGAKLQFGSGAVLASFVFFYGLGYGARILRPIFQKPVTWKILEFIIGVVMISISVSLIAGN